jgi:mannose-6-phosphate isomerase
LIKCDSASVIGSSSSYVLADGGRCDPGVRHIMDHDIVRTPHRLAPRLVARPWGGRTLASLLGGTARREPIGEAWLAGPAERVVGGHADGQTLDQLACTFGAGFVGTRAAARWGARFPLLIKLLDAAEPLSVQVHPDDAYALRHERASGHLGKDEAWFVLAGEPGAHVMWGWRRPVAVDEVREAALAGTLEALLRVVEVAPGDVVLNVAGTVHAVGAGILLYEVQQASDLTYRLYDYGRMGLDGAPRQLHLDAALAVADLAPGETPAPVARAVAPGRTLLAAPGSFRFEHWEVGGAAPVEQAWSVDSGSLEVWTVLAGSARLEVAGVTWPVSTFETLVLPARLGHAAWRGRARLARATT